MQVSLSGISIVDSSDLRGLIDAQTTLTGSLSAITYVSVAGSIISSTGLTGSLSSRERPNIMVPNHLRSSVFHIASYLRSTREFNSVETNQLVMEWLIAEGIPRTELNEMLYTYLGNLGYTGTLDDRLKQWKNQTGFPIGFPYTLP